MRFLVMLILVFYFSFVSCGHDEADHVHADGTVHSSADDQKEGTEHDDDGHDHEAEEKEGEEHDDDKENANEGGKSLLDKLTVPAEEAGGIPFDKNWEELIGLKTVRIERRNLELVHKVPGRLVPDQNNVAVISPFIESNVNEIFVNIGDRVKKGDLLVCLESPDIGILRAEYTKAKAELDISRLNFTRKEKLRKEDIISEKSFLETELQKRLASVNYNYALKKLLAMGIPKEEIENPPAGHSEAVGSTIHIHSPINGIVVHRHLNIGEKVSSSDKIFEIVNIKNVWLEADIFEKDLTRIKLGQKVNVTVSAYPDEVFTGNTFFIGSILNSKTKTIKIMVNITNSDERLKPGMFAHTGIVTGVRENALVVPGSAVLEDENLKIVFIKEEDSFHRHEVKTGIETEKFIEILSGLEDGEFVVTQGNFQLKSKSKMGGVDPHAGHNH